MKTTILVRGSNTGAAVRGGVDPGGGSLHAPVLATDRHGLPDWIDAQVTAQQRALTSPATTNELDSVIQTAPAATVVTDYTVTITERRGSVNPIVVAHSTPAVSSLNADGNLLTFVSAGQDVLTISSPARVITIPLQFISSVNNFTPVVVNGVAGSLRKSCTDAIDLLLPGKNPTTDKFLLAQPEVDGAYAWNTGCWAYPIDLTCLMVRDSWSLGWGGPHWAPGTAIGGPFTLHANHFWPNGGSTLSWLTRGNARVDRTLIYGASCSFLSGAYPGYPDLWVGMLDSDLPSTIKPAKVLPNGWEPKLPVTSKGPRGYRMPCLWLDQELKANVGTFISHGLSFTTEYTGSISLTMDQFTVNAPLDATRNRFYESVVDHDSGQPTFLIVNGDPVLIGPTTSGGPSGSFLASYKTQINALMDDLWAAHRSGSNPYHLTEVDLSGFNTYT